MGSPADRERARRMLVIAAENIPSFAVDALAAEFEAVRAESTPPAAVRAVVEAASAKWDCCPKLDCPEHEALAAALAAYNAAGLPGTRPVGPKCGHVSVPTSGGWRFKCRLTLGHAGPHEWRETEGLLANVGAVAWDDSKVWTVPPDDPVGEAGTCETCGGEGMVDAPCPDQKPAKPGRPHTSCTVAHFQSCPACRPAGTEVERG